MKKIRVLHVFECFRQGGIENFVMNVYRNIDREKFQFDFAFITRIEGVFDQEAKALGGNIYYFDTEEKSILNYRRSLTRIINEFGPYDVVHSHMYFFSGYILGIAKACGVKVRIAHSHDTEKGRKRNITRVTYEKFMRFMIRKKSSHMIACSDLAGKYVFGKNANYTILYNGIDVNRFRFNPEVRNELRERLGVSDCNVLINVGRFDVQKNHFFMLDFFKELSAKDESMRIILIGSGDMLDEIKKYIMEQKLEGKVVILSNIMNIEDYYCAADCFVLPSKYEGMPIVSVEAQCSGLPSLLSDKITREVSITDLIKYLPIDHTVNEWTVEVQNTLSKRIDRELYYKKIKGTEFDIGYLVDKLSKIYAYGEYV